MAQIHHLDEDVINTIAAGEVVESPASIVKELMENAIDAGSTHVDVAIERGGFTSLSVSDNGEGISYDDLLLAVTRHATSKLSSSDQLHSLSTLGFRGEALASIAAVSECTIHSKKQGAKLGYLLSACDGSIIMKPRVQGTRIVVEKLFYSTPARKKFQKSIGASTSEITRLMQTFILCYSHVVFSFSVDDKVVLKAIKNGKSAFIERVKYALPASSLINGIHFEKTIGDMSVKGVISPSSSASKGKKTQYFFVNNRVVHSDLLSESVRIGYGTRIDTNTHPQCVIHISMPPQHVDVNVHPQKKHVRFNDELAVLEHTSALVHDALTEKVQEAPPLTLDFSAFSIMPPPRKSKEYTSDMLNTPVTNTIQSSLLHTYYVEPLCCVDHIALFLSISLYEKYPHVFQEKNGIVFMNIKAAKRHLIYEEASKKIEADACLPVQSFLLPFTFTVEKDVFLHVKEYRSVLKSSGIDIDCSSPNIISVRGAFSGWQITSVSICKEVISTILDECLRYINDTKGQQKKIVRNLCSKLDVNSEKGNVSQMLDKIVSLDLSYEDFLGEGIFGQMETLKMERFICGKSVEKEKKKC